MTNDEDKIPGEAFGGRFWARQQHEILVRVALYERRRRKVRAGWSLAAAASILFAALVWNLYPGPAPAAGPVDLEGAEMVQAFSDPQQDPLEVFGPWTDEDTPSFQGDIAAEGDWTPLLDELIDEAGRPATLGQEIL